MTINPSLQLELAEEHLDALFQDKYVKSTLSLREPYSCRSMPPEVKPPSFSAAPPQQPSPLLRDGQQPLLWSIPEEE